MKKHLIAAAVAAAVAVPAMAQNVSIYGIVDASVQRYDNGSDTFLRTNESNLATSRLGFRGTEDLGGGLKAEFQLESRFNPQNGNLGTTNAADNQIFTREAWVGLSGGFGAVRLGRSDVTAAQAIDSSVSQGGDLFLNASAQEINSNDQSDVIRYTTPTFNGFSAQAGYKFANSKTDTTDGKDQVTGLYGQYVQGALGVYLGRDTTNVNNGVDTKLTNFGAKYDFGMVAVGYSYSKNDFGTAADRKINTLSAAVPVANGVKLHAGIQNDKIDAGEETKTTTLAVTKALSKRTTLYGAYADIDNKTAVDTSALTLGVSHSF